VTQKLIIGIDPGQTGALAMLEDGEPAGFFDMPTMDRKKSGHEINGVELADLLRGRQTFYAGVPIIIALELVNAMPSFGKGQERRGMGSSSAFRFGEGYGVIKGVLAALGLGFRLAQPRIWKKHHGLLGSQKDAARTLAIQRFPNCAQHLTRKKDIGRSDALLIAAWAYETWI
jgi:crossover junction endodeoxyribonuclease RuvC